MMLIWSKKKIFLNETDTLHEPVNRTNLLNSNRRLFSSSKNLSPEYCERAFYDHLRCSGTQSQLCDDAFERYLPCLADSLEKLEKSKLDSTKEVSLPSEVAETSVSPTTETSVSVQNLSPEYCEQAFYDHLLCGENQSQWCDDAFERFLPCLADSLENLKISRLDSTKEVSLPLEVAETSVSPTTETFVSVQTLLNETLNHVKQFLSPANDFSSSNAFNWLELSKPLLEEEYFQIRIFIVFSIFLASLIVVLSYLLVTQKPESEKLSTYECGFEPYEDAKNRFDVQFYTVALLFVLFDIEMIILLPWCLSLSSLSALGYWSMLEFLLELGLGFVYVWCIGALDW